MARPLGPVPEHGTRQRYQLRAAPCRCLPCRAANKRYITDRRLARRAIRATWSQPTLPDELIPKAKRDPWANVVLPTAPMIVCRHEGMGDLPRERCAWCGAPMRQAG